MADNLTTEDLEPFRLAIARRDSLAMKIGVAVYEHDRQIGRLARLIDQSKREDAELIAEALRRRDLDPDRHRIDLQTGEISER